ncbi:MAG: hypothetical protein AB7J13_08080 [Pyrinomonadaceae bacterium]
MNTAAEIKAELADDWLPLIYEQKVRSQRTRAFSLEVAKRENHAEIQYTLLGIELKVGRRRFACPDLATARYLRVFARVGCREFAVPYDISQISGVADELEMSWQRCILLIDEGSKGDSATAVRKAVVRSIRDELVAIGPGEPMPLFDRETRQRKP